MKKPAAGKRTRPPRRVDFTRGFLKDWERFWRSGRYDMNRLKAVMLELIANEAPLGPERRDHALRGAWANHRECLWGFMPITLEERTVYERLYCARGNMENTIKEQQLDLFSDRTSATCFAANQLRLLFSAFASILFSAIRQALHGTRLARATAGTLRLKLLKIGARVMVSVRRVKVAMDSVHPSAAAFAQVHARLPE